MAGSKWHAKNPPKFCPDEFSVTTGRIVLKFGGYVRYGYEVLQEGFKGSPGWEGRGVHAAPSSLHKRPDISETVQIPTPKPYILLFLIIRHIQ